MHYFESRTSTDTCHTAVDKCLIRFMHRIMRPQIRTIGETILREGVKLINELINNCRLSTDTQDVRANKNKMRCFSSDALSKIISN